MSATLLALALAAAPAVLDGRLNPAEWSRAAATDLRHGATLLTHWDGDTLALGVRLPPGSLRYLDLYVEDASGRVVNLHASMQQGERVLTPPWTDASPPFNWGPLAGWRSSVVGASGAGKDAPIAEALLPYEGFELRIPARHLGSPPWRLRIELRDFAGEATDRVWPARSSRNDSSDWATLDAIGAKPRQRQR